MTSNKRNNSTGWKNFSLSTKINLIQAIVLIFLMALATAIQSYLLFHSLEKENIVELKQMNNAILDIVSAFGENLIQQTERLGGILESYFPASFKLENVNSTPILYHGGKSINGEINEVDRFARFTKGAATVFVRQGDNFLRIATSIKKENGERAINTMLDEKHPARSALLRGEIYTGKFKLFGRDYITNYRPIKNDAGQVIGALFAGFDFTESLIQLRQKILSYHIGDTGYSYIMAGTTASEEPGTLIIHHDIEGSNLLKVQDADGKIFAQEMIEKQNGTIYYSWINPGEKVSRLKVVAYTPYQRWGWIIASGSYMDEFTNQAQDIVYQGIAVIFIVVVLVIGIMLLITYRWITQPLSRAVTLSEQIAAGDLTVRLDSLSGDEIGKLVYAMNEMVGRLRTIILQFRNTAEHLFQKTQQLTETARAVASGSEEQSAAAMSMAASLEQMTTSIGMVSQHANDARQLSNQSGQTAENGAAVMRQTVNGMESIASTVKQSSQNVEQLGKQSEEISAIVSTIKGIAEQTNLLALNAAIEAARAGEQGRGFAVVADEVKKLAERTTASTQEISQMILRIQSGTQDAVRGMATGVELVEQGANLANAAGNTVADIQHSTQQVVEVVAAISHALQEQNAAGIEIARNVERIAQQAEQNNQRSQTAAEAMTDLQKLARSLTESIERFQT